MNRIKASKTESTQHKIKLPMNVVTSKELETKLEEEMLFTNSLSKAEIPQPLAEQQVEGHAGGFHLVLP